MTKLEMAREFFRKYPDVIDRVMKTDSGCVIKSTSRSMCPVGGTNVTGLIPPEEYREDLWRLPFVKYCAVTGWDFVKIIKYCRARNAGYDHDWSGVFAYLRIP